MYKQCLAALALALGIGVGDANASYPERPITLIVPFAVGGGSDGTARLLVPYLEKYLGGARIAVVNKPGAGGNLAYTDLSRAAPDGYTIGMVNFPDVVSGPISSDVSYTVDSFTYIGAINREPTTISVLTSSPYETLKDFLDAAAENPGKITVAVPALDNVHNIGLSLLSLDADVEFNPVPMQGGGPARNALLGGHVDAAALSLGAIAGRADNVRILAQMATEREGAGADVPTFAEEGIELENYVIRTFAVHADVSAEIRETLGAAFRKAMDDPEMRDAARKQKIDLTYIPGAELDDIARRLDGRISKLWKVRPWIER